MKTFKDVLHDEHQVVHRVVAAMSTVADLLEFGQEVRPDTLAGLVQFLRVFAGTCHQDKEETYLFPLLETKSSIEVNRQIQQLEREHRTIAELFFHFSQLSLIYPNDSRTVKPRLLEAIRSLVALYPVHIWREEFLLFPLAEQLLSERESSRLKKEFEQIDQKMGGDVHQAFEELADLFEFVVEYAYSGGCALCSPAA